MLGLIITFKYSIVFLISYPFTTLCVIIAVGQIKKLTIEEMKAYSIAGKMVQESLSSIRTVITFGLEKKFIKKYAEKLSTVQAITVKKGCFLFK